MRAVLPTPRRPYSATHPRCRRREYYIVTGDNDGGLNVLGACRCRWDATTRSLIIQYTLDGMVFTDTSPTLTIADGVGKPAPAPAGRRLATPPGARERHQGNEHGVLHPHPRRPLPMRPTAVACLVLDRRCHIGGGRRDHHGTSDNLPLPATNSASYSGAVRGAKAISVTVTKMNPTALVSDKVPELR